jgi:hypothetical protein
MPDRGLTAGSRLGMGKPDRTPCNCLRSALAVRMPDLGLTAGSRLGMGKPDRTPCNCLRSALAVRMPDRGLTACSRLGSGNPDRTQSAPEGTPYATVCLTRAVHESAGGRRRGFRENAQRPHATVCFTGACRGRHRSEGGGGGGRGFRETRNDPPGQDRGHALGSGTRGCARCDSLAFRWSRLRPGWVCWGGTPSPGSLRDPTLVRSSRPKPAGGRGEQAKCATTLARQAPEGMPHATGSGGIAASRLPEDV